MTPDQAEKVLATIDQRRPEIVAFLSRLIAFPSVTGEEAGIQKFIADHLDALGLAVDVWVPDVEQLARHPAYIAGHGDYHQRPNMVGLWHGAGGGRSLLLNGHVDVIPAGPTEAWVRPPFGAEIADGRLYGRGASDMKSGLAAMTMAVDTLVRLGLKLKGDVILEYVMDEELTGNGTLAAVLKGYRADAGICCETSSLHVQPACIGRVWFEILVRGKPAGIQRRFEGVNAIEKGQEIVKAVANLERIRINELAHPLYPDKPGSLPCMVCVFEAGSFPSAFPDTCLLKGSLATLPGEETAAVKEDFIRHVLTFCRTDPWLRDHPPEITFKGYCGDSAEIPTDHPIVKSLAGRFREVTGRPPEITGRQGAADIRYLIKYAQTPTVIFGPGLTEQMHANNEFVVLDDLIVATKILALTIVDWCG
ncbi:MAG: ArgE/DapE family deacylase [Thermodesulfobacteriota bacterium]